jgi:hypothetical protein
VVDTLATSPRLVDVLTDVPAFAERLAGDLGALTAAVDNPEVAGALSHTPGRFDTVPDADLRDALLSTRSPRLPAPADPGPSASPWTGPGRRFRPWTPS